MIPSRNLNEVVKAMNYDDYEQIRLVECSKKTYGVQANDEEGWIYVRRIITSSSYI